MGTKHGGGCFAETEQMAGYLQTIERNRSWRRRVEADGRIDGHQGRNLGLGGEEGGDQAKQDLLNQTMRDCSEDKSQKDFLTSRLRRLPFCHHTPTLKFTKSRFSVY